MDELLEFVPCRLNRRDARTAWIEDADGWPTLVFGPLGTVRGRLCVPARWLHAACGQYRVRFRDGPDTWVVPKDLDGKRILFPLGWGA